MKVIVDIKGKLKKNDILIYDGEQFKPVNRDEFLFKTKKELEETKNEFELLKKDIDTFKTGVNDKLKDYHNILQNLTKEN